MSEKHLILLGTHSTYIHAVQFDPANKTLVEINRLEVTRDPSWLTRHPSLPNIVYSNGHVEGKVFCLQVGLDGKMEVLDEAVSGAGGPTHLAVLGDKSALLIAHYGKEQGDLSFLPLDPDTGRFLRTSTIPQHSFFPPYTPSTHPRQNAPHIHQVLVHNNEVITCDLGNNKVWRLKLGGEGDETRWMVKSTIDDFEGGDGPRHATIHPNGKYIYVSNELSSYLTVHTLPETGPSKLIHRHPLLPAHDTTNKAMLAAGILYLPPTDQFAKGLLILSNRFSKSNEKDALALFTVSPDGEQVEPAEEKFYWGIGSHIRCLGADPSGGYILTAGRDGGGVVILQRVGDGSKLEEIARVDIPSVVVPLWMS